MPSAPGGHVKKAHCPPVRSFILFERKGVIIGAKSSRVTRSTIEVYLTFEVPQDVTLQLIAPEISISNKAGDKAQGLLTPTGHNKDLPWSQKLTGRTRERFWEEVTLYGTTEHAYHVFRAEFEFPASQAHQIVLPRMLISGDEISLPPITFERASESWLSGGNC